MTNMNISPPACSPWRPSQRILAVCLFSLLVIPGLYWLAFRNVATDSLFSAIACWEIPDLAALVVLNVLILQAMCFRWALILKRWGHRIPFFRLVFYRLGANAVSYLTPGPQFGGEPLQVHWLVHSHGVAPDAAGASVVVDRLLELMANLCFLVLAGVVLMFGTSHRSLLQIGTMTLIGLLCLGLAVFCRAVSSGRTPLARIARFGAERFGIQGWASSAVQLLERGERQALSILHVPARVLGLYGACSGIQWLLMLSELWFIYHVMGVSLIPLQLMGLMGASRLAFLLPLPGGLGALEASQVMVLTTMGLDPVAGLAACLIMRARDLCLIGVGALETMCRLMRSPTRVLLNPVRHDLNGSQ